MTGSDAAESVATATLQSEAQFVESHLLTLVFLGFQIEFVEQLHTHFEFVAFHLLHHEELDAFAVIVAQEFLKLFGLVVLAPKTEHEQKFTALGVPIKFVIMRKKPGPVELDPVRWVMPGAFARLREGAREEEDTEETIAE